MRLYIAILFWAALVGGHSLQASQPPVSFGKGALPVFLAQGGGGGGEKIKEALVKVFDTGLKWLRAVVGMFLLLYGIYLGVSVAFGQSQAGALVNFFIGSAIALGAQAVAGMYQAVFSGGGEG